MAHIERSADAVWEGDLRSGTGHLSTPTGVLNQDPYTFTTRFEDQPGTNPEELVAAAHAGCFTMNLSGVLGRNGYTPEKLSSHATVMMDRTDAGFSVTKILLEVEGQVPGIDAETFRTLADEAERTCPISRLLRPGLQELELVATLKSGE
jgi:lipoyl-dependent peroxiredoxin